MKGTIKSTKELVVAGGGAAGFFCAINAARLCPDLRVTILERSGKLLSKVKISGGGRCNFTHACFDPDEMSRQYPRGRYFVRKSFHRFFTTDTIHWFESRGVAVKEEADGRMFPVSDSSQTIIDCLLNEAETYHLTIRTHAGIGGVRKSGDQFLLILEDGSTLQADLLCIATGGYPKAQMFEWLRQTGHTIEEPVPSLFTFNLPGNPVTTLMGVSVPDVRIRIPDTSLEEQGPILITHWGLSGPAVLRLSAWGARELAKMNWKFSVAIHWLPEWNEQELRAQFTGYRNERASQKITNRNPFGLPARLWEFLVRLSGTDPGTRWSDLPAKMQNRLVKLLCHYECEVSGKTTFKEEFVTAGGIKLSEIDPLTMMSRKLEGLFFAGEVMDVDAITGGYNFQHAWTSGYIAADSIAARL